jgi:hypothetical protein
MDFTFGFSSLRVVHLAFFPTLFVIINTYLPQDPEPTSSSFMTFILDPLRLLFKYLATHFLILSGRTPSWHPTPGNTGSTTPLFPHLFVLRAVEPGPWERSFAIVRMAWSAQLGQRTSYLVLAQGVAM